MRSVIRKSLSVVLAVLMLLSFASVAFASVYDQKFTANEDETQTITGYSETAVLENGVLELEGILEIGDFKLVFSAVGDGAFAYDALVESDYATLLASIKEVVIGEHIKNIGAKAFADLPELTKVTFKDDITIAEEAFTGCEKLETVTFCKKAAIGEKAFAGCTSLKEISFADANCSADNSFDGCEALAEFKVADGVVFGCSANAIKGTAFYKNFALDFVTVGTTLAAYKGNDAEVTLPAKVNAIGCAAFEGNKNLTTINFTKEIETVCDRAFANCKNLKTVNYAKDGELKNIGNDVFANSAYYNKFNGDFFVIGSRLIKYLGEEETVYIPYDVTSVADDAFDGCFSAKDPDGYTWQISSIYVPAALTDFSSTSFATTKLENGKYSVPQIFAYTGSDSAKALKDAGYDVSLMPVKADIDKDGVISAADARLALRYAVKLEKADEAAKIACDVDMDNAVTPADARIILRYAVKLEEGPDALLNAPVSKYDILVAYSKAMATIADNGAGYTKTVSNKITGKDMSSAGLINLYKTLSTKGVTNSKTVYTHDTAEAAANVDLSTLRSSDEVKSATCEVKEAKYYITIKFNDVLDNKGTSDITELFPVTTYNDYKKAFEGKKWWTPITDGDYHVNGIKKFDVTYTDPTVTLVCDKDTYEVSECTISCGYLIAVDGFINMLPVSSALYKNEVATMTRLDTITYSDIVYKTMD